MSAWTRGIRVGSRAVACFLLLAGGASAVEADLLFVVNSTLDRIDVSVGDGECVTDQATCTLRAAVMEASAATGSGTITIVLPAGRYVITRSAAVADGGDLNLAAPTVGSPVIVVSGEGPSTTIIDANLVDRAFAVSLGRTARISGVSIVNGFGEEFAGGVGTSGTLTMSYCVVTGNESEGGGGIFNTGELTLIRSTVSGNRAVSGGGILNFGELTVDQSTISGNEATEDGGGIHNFLFPDLAPSVEEEGTTYLVNSTISGNKAGRDGGGIYDNGETWTYNATIVFNHADADEDELGLGGGIFRAGAVYLRNTVVAGNQIAYVLDNDCSDGVGVFGRSVFWTTFDCVVTPQNGDASSGDVDSLAEIGPLRSNGGWTETHALLAPSTMIDGGTAPPGCTYDGSLLVDQRGGTRGLGTLCDLGAFEAGALPVGSIFSDGFEAGNLYAW